MPEQSGLNPKFRLDPEAMLPGPNDTWPESVRAAREVAAMINVDRKTGLSNEGFWKSQLSETIDELTDGDELTVYVADLDGFKTVNDELGHNMGDELLNIVGAAFRQTFKRKSDFSTHGSRDGTNGIARLGGDEFAVFSVRTQNDREKHKRDTSRSEESIRQAEVVNHTLVELLQGTKFEAFRIKLSIGSADYVQGDTVETIFAKADAAMFNVKYRGKIDALSDRDIKRLEDEIPHLQKVGARIEPWLLQAMDERSIKTTK